jgi:hypothetical protein
MGIKFLTQTKFLVLFVSISVNEDDDKIVLVEGKHD